MLAGAGTGGICCMVAGMDWKQVGRSWRQLGREIANAGKEERFLCQAKQEEKMVAKFLKRMEG